MQKFIQRHADNVVGSLSGFDRLLFRGTLRGLEHVAGMLAYLSTWSVLLKHFGTFVEGVTARVKEASLAAAVRTNRPIIHLPSPDTRKEEFARSIAEKDGIRDGLVCVLTAVEPCLAYDVRPNRQTKHLDLVRRSRKCLYLYHYFIHPLFGFMHARLQTWFPLSLQIWINGREWLSRQLDRRGIAYSRRGNCFPWIDDLPRAQAIMDRQLLLDWTKHLRTIARRVNPIYPQVLGSFPSEYYWSVQDSEWATDILFRDHRQLTRLYPYLIHHALTTFGSTEVMRFLGRKVPDTGYPGGLRAEVTSDIHRRFEGLRLKHRVGKNSIKLYDKQGTILRTETTITHPRDFKVFRPKEGDPDGRPELLPLRRGVSDLRRRAQVSQAANERYLNTLAVVDTRSKLGDLTDPLCRSVTWKGRRVRALNPWAPHDRRLLEVVSRGEFLLHGFRNADLRDLLHPNAPPADQRRHAASVTRQIRLLRAHGLVLKVPHTHRYRISDKGRIAIAALLAARHANPEIFMPKAA